MDEPYSLNPHHLLWGIHFPLIEMKYFYWLPIQSRNFHLQLKISAWNIHLFITFYFKSSSKILTDHRIIHSRAEKKKWQRILQRWCSTSLLDWLVITGYETSINNLKRGAFYKINTIRYSHWLSTLFQQIEQPIWTIFLLIIIEKNKVL